MKIIRLFTATIIAAMVFGTVEAGRNVGATVEIDWDATTPRIESKCGSGDEIALAVQVNGSADLTGYFVSLEYDTSKVRMIGVLNHLPGKSAFIESCGGKAGPLMVVPNDRGSVEIAAGIVRADAAQAPDGSGVLVYARFSRKQWSEDSPVKLVTVQLSDLDGTVDTILSEEKQPGNGK